MTDVDSQVARLALVRDTELTEVATSDAARELLAAVRTEPAPRRSVGRWVAAAAVVAAATAAAVIVPSLGDDLGAPVSYANAAIAVTRDGDDLVARIKDPLADRERYVEAFRAVGKDVVIDLVPVSPRLVGQLLATSSSANEPVEVSTELVPPPGRDPSVCETRPMSCTIVIRLGQHSTATVRYTFGRAAQPGESYQDPTPEPGPPPTTGPNSGGGN